MELMPELETIDSPSDDVRAAIAQLSNPDVAREPPEPAEPETDLTAEAETAEQKADRERDEKGRFVAKAPEKAAAEPPAKDLPTKDAKEGQPTGLQAPAAKPPPSWLAEAKVEWSKLSPAVQQAVLKREQETSDGFAQKSTELKRWQELEGIIAPRREYFKRFGFHTDVQAVNHLLSLSDSMERDPANTIAFLAKHYGVSLTNGAQQPQPQQSQNQPQQQQPPPQDLAALVREQVGLISAQSEIDEFRADASHPHFPMVQPTMAAMLSDGRATTLEEAYSKAVSEVPALRELEELKAKNRQKDEEREAAAKLEAKKRASNASLSGAPHGAAPARKTNTKPPSNAHDDALEDVRAAIAQLS